MFATRAIVLAPIWGVAAVWAGVIVKTVGPDLEIQAFPVISGQSYRHVTRSDKQACWRWDYTKERNATLLRKVFYAERDDGIRYPLKELRPDLGIPSNDSTTAKAGVTRTIPECVLLPAALTDVPHFVVYGHNFYRPWHQIWELDQAVVPIDVNIPAVIDAPHDAAPSPEDGR